ncbi:DUF7336 domain-containing protein [Bradyrhizobium sp. HKCCYLRH2060]|uniref:DUF7336 domain-containing protein n=1 Tax=unclassified Bradyrhizobium TaxID=2631580 RepID=UPI003EB761AB
MTVYVLSENDYDAGYAEGVYSSPEKAAAAAANVSSYRRSRPFVVTEFRLDADEPTGRSWPVHDGKLGEPF